VEHRVAGQEQQQSGPEEPGHHKIDTEQDGDHLDGGVRPGEGGHADREGQHAHDQPQPVPADCDGGRGQYGRVFRYGHRHRPLPAVVRQAAECRQHAMLPRENRSGITLIA